MHTYRWTIVSLELFLSFTTLFSLKEVDITSMYSLYYVFDSVRTQAFPTRFPELDLIFTRSANGGFRLGKVYPADGADLDRQ